MNVEVIVVGEFQVNCLVVWDKEPSAIVVDPGDDARLVLEFLDKKRLGVAAYVMTHAHMDHISGLAAMCRAKPAPIGMHPADLKWAFTEANQMPPYYGVPEKPPKIERELADDSEYTDAGLTYRIIATPGHSPGAVCIHFESENVLISGDTLFAGSVGRTDLPGGNARTLQQSLRKLARLPDNTIVYPGHGPTTTIGEEKVVNYFLQRLDGKW